jgi:uncharacterized membrane protein YphA (DoxX/SURF4 family)
MHLPRQSSPYGLLVARLVVGVIFLIAGIDKVAAPGAFADAVRAFHILPSALVLPFAFVVPWLELLVAVYLIGGFMCRFAAGGAVVLLGMFVLALGLAIVTGNTAHPCGCFGSKSNPVVTWLSGGNTITWWDVLRDLVLMALSLLLFARGAGLMSIDSLLRHHHRQYG